ncbi:MAG: hypothetical protein KDC54_12535 [Lewinella sp.]|nr:hypothetical protein [Lewinella sp.]
MRKTKFLLHPFSLLSLIALAVYALACTSAAAETEQPQQSLNPNGDSELALLMRAMYDDAAQMKAAIARGEEPVPGIDHAKLLTASATEPEKAASTEYQVWAQSYLQVLKMLEEASPEETDELFGNLVNSCMGCHTELCPGPKMKIRHLQ